MNKVLSKTAIASTKLKDVKLSRIFQLFKRYRWLLAGILGLALASAIIGIGPPLILKEIIDRALPNADKPLLWILVGWMVALPLIGGLLSVWQNHLNNKVGQSVMRDLRHALFGNLQKQSMAFFTQSRSGEVIQRLTGDVQAVQNVVTGTVVNAITQMVIVVTTVFILFRLNWQLAILSMVILPMFVLPVRKVSAARKKLRLETQKVRGDMASQLGEIFGVSGALLTRIFAREKLQETKFSELNEEVMRLELRLNLIGRWYGMVIGVLAPAGTAIIYLYGGFSVINSSMSLGDIIAFAAFVGRLYGPIAILLNLQVETVTALGVFQRLFEYLDLKAEIIDSPDAVQLPIVSGRIAYNQVSFAYLPERYALKEVSFTVGAGELVAFVGPSGAGKSTLIGMISRLYDPTKGNITIDGLDIKKVKLDSLREQIAYVTQESFLFHASIRENLLFAVDNASQDQLEDACKQAYIHDFIASLPDGYDTMVGERGHRLSGGERQRLAIARAILKNPRVLILDEATSHLDSESEAYVQAALEELMRNRTTLVIAHRLSTVLAANKIIVLEAGIIVEEGNHDELLAREGLYARLFRTQFARVAGTDAAL
ncbi:ABC transporter ATP-binding protein [Paenibacillus psychroresistens]|uniref:ABC transporter ATP-binding protein n=1 Tax=Paenibacillus psychroresistens TaxID=1778678 RepID=A0A6B8RFD2_9BACL|nr:ABC transporter ATP-binding protein [Paenibacillus psychroresistens]QGQ94434.1 ABC transporter ATP-binding protein [Paenibacillus psychroresistens]